MADTIPDVIAERRASPRPDVVEPRVRMPDFVRPRRGARHTLDTALRALRRLGIDDARVVVESAGAGWEPNTVVRQQPVAGTMLETRARIVLGVSGIGALESLPYALRDVDESAFGVDPLVALFDNPVYKLLHHVRGGGEFFALRAGDTVTARRWIEQVFHLDPSPWRPVRWPAVARLLTALHRTGGRDVGLALALRLVCGLPLAGVRLVRAMIPVAPEARFALGRAAARLGVDTLLGEGLAETAQLEVTIGPVPIERYRVHAEATESAERHALYTLVLPAHLAATVRERWIVGNPDETARLAAPDPPLASPPTVGSSTFAGAAVLGLTTRLAPIAPGAGPERAT